MFHGLEGGCDGRGNRPALPDQPTDHVTMLIRNRLDGLRCRGSHSPGQSGWQIGQPHGSTGLNLDRLVPAEPALRTDPELRCRNVLPMIIDVLRAW